MKAWIATLRTCPHWNDGPCDACIRDVLHEYGSRLTMRLSTELEEGKVDNTQLRQMIGRITSVLADVIGLLDEGERDASERRLRTLFRDILAAGTPA